MCTTPQRVATQFTYPPGHCCLRSTRGRMHHTLPCPFHAELWEARVREVPYRSGFVCRCRQLDRSQPAHSTQRPGPCRPHDRNHVRWAHALGVRLRNLDPRDPARRGRRRRSCVGVRPAPGRDRQVAAEQAGRRCAGRGQGSGHVRQRPIHVCRPCRSRSTRGLPDMPTASGTVKADDFATAVAQASAAAGRDEMLPLLTGVRSSSRARRCRSWRRTVSVPACATSPGTPSAATSPPMPWSRPAFWARPRGRWPAAATSPSLSPPARVR